MRKWRQFLFSVQCLGCLFALCPFYRYPEMKFYFRNWFSGGFLVVFSFQFVLGVYIAGYDGATAIPCFLILAEFLEKL